MARAEGLECHCLTVRYGQRHQAELEAAGRVARALGAADHRFADVDLRVFGGSALTAEIEVPKDREEEAMTADIPITYVPARNTIMLSLALGFAEVIGAESIWCGVNAVDYSGYPDCRPEFIAAFAELARLATKAGVEGRPMRIEAPLIHLQKHEIIRAGLDLGVDFGLTHSCYDPDDQGRACGRCDSCRIRRAAFHRLGLADPALAHLDA
ncbi:MAG: 7-cyano-7-deazaguanine synthase QueC [Fimbriimonadaceae bacterium]|nr:7-cyano-7-deazaguanine synthase QueC [Fimbriimonadaceae bacterium]